METLTGMNVCMHSASVQGYSEVTLIHDPLRYWKAVSTVTSSDTPVHTTAICTLMVYILLASMLNGCTKTKSCLRNNSVYLASISHRRKKTNKLVILKVPFLMLVLTWPAHLPRFFGYSFIYPSWVWRNVTIYKNVWIWTKTAPGRYIRTKQLHTRNKWKKKGKKQMWHFLMPFPWFI